MEDQIEEAGVPGYLEVARTDLEGVAAALAGHTGRRPSAVMAVSHTVKVRGAVQMWWAEHTAGRM